VIPHSATITTRHLFHMRVYLSGDSRRDHTLNKSFSCSSARLGVRLSELFQSRRPLFHPALSDSHPRRLAKEAMGGCNGPEIASLPYRGGWKGEVVHHRKCRLDCCTAQL